MTEPGAAQLDRAQLDRVDHRLRVGVSNFAYLAARSGRAACAVLVCFAGLACFGITVRPTFAATKDPQPAAPEDDNTYETLRPGTYSCTLSGLLCEACAKAAADAVAIVPGVEKASIDFERRKLTLTIAADRTVPISTVRRALEVAAKRINLDTEFHITKIRYSP